MTPTEAARKLIETDPDTFPMTYNAVVAKYAKAIVRALLDAEEREREYKHAIDEIFGTNDLSLIYSVIYNLRFKLGQDPATGKGGE